MSNQPESQQGPVGGREERGDADGSRKQPPHRTPNADEARLQKNHPSPEDAPVLPANAQGVDKRDADEASPEIDEESMYVGRPEEHKDRPAASPDTP